MSTRTLAHRAVFQATPTPARVIDRVISLLVGTGFTLAVFALMAHFEQAKASRPAAVVEDFHSTALPLEIPPPPAVQTETAPVTEMITGIDVAAAESPVQIALSVPILESLSVPPAPPARIMNSTLRSDFKPQLDVTADFDHVFQQSEVDQRPAVLVNTVPFIPINVHRGVRMLRVVLLMVIDARGVGSNIRVLTSSGNATFDGLIVKCVQEEWEFSPAVRKGHKVKCLVQRSVTVRWDSSPFDS